MFIVSYPETKSHLLRGMRDISRDFALSNTEYEVETVDDNKQILHLVVPGFERDEIEIKVQDQKLIVSAERKGAEKDGASYLKVGAFARKVRTTFNLARFIEVKNARLKNGILSIDIEQILPEEKKPRIVEITAE